MSLSSTAIKRKNTVIHLKDTILDHDYAIHILFNVKFLDAFLCSMHIEFNIFLIGLHIKFFIRTSEHHLEIVNSANFFWTNINNKNGLAFLAHRDV